MLCRLQCGVDDIIQRKTEEPNFIIALWKEGIQTLQQELKLESNKENIAALQTQVKEISEHVSRYVTTDLQQIARWSDT